LQIILNDQKKVFINEERTSELWKRQNGNKCEQVDAKNCQRSEHTAHQHRHPMACRVAIQQLDGVDPVQGEEEQGVGDDGHHAGTSGSI
jgi:hypothetical protein